MLMQRYPMLIKAALLFVSTMTFSAAVVRAQQTCTPPPPNMVGWWPADGNYTDIIGGNNGTPMGGVTFASGEVGQAFSFNGSASVQVPNSGSLSLGAGEITVDAWISTPFGGNPNYGIIAGKNNPVYPFQGYGLRITDDNRVEFYAVDCATPTCGFTLPGGGGIEQPVRSVRIVADSTFHHVAGVRRANGTREIYVDGTLDSTRVESMWNTDNGNALYIGQLDGTNQQFLSGLIDEVEIFNRALSAVEIQAIYSAGSAGNCKTNQQTCPVAGQKMYSRQIIPLTFGCPTHDLTNCLLVDSSGNCLMNYISDTQDNEFQVWCRKPSLLDGHLFSWYELVYLPARGDYKFAGKCPYEGGQDEGIVYFGATSAVSQPNCFIGSEWQVVDGGIFDDELLYAPWCPSCRPYSYVYDFDVASNMTTTRHFDPDHNLVAVSTQDPLPEFNNLPPILDLNAIPLGGSPAGTTTPGDANVDGRVDCADMAMVRGSLGKNNGDPGFVAAADINRDNIVDIRDLAILAGNITTSCPNLISFTTLLNDIADSFRLGLIDNGGIAQSLSSQTQSAADAVARGQVQAGINILNAFMNHVQSQTNKHISSAAAAVLINDAASLVSKISQ